MSDDDRPLTADDINWYGTPGSITRAVYDSLPPRKNGNGSVTTSAAIKAVKTAPPKPPSLDLIRVGDLIAEEDDPVEYVVDGLLQRGSVNVLCAKPKVGKSTLARHLAVAVARGDDFLGRRCPDLGVVWYLAFEGARHDIKKAFRKLGATADDPIHLFIGTAPKAVIARVRERAISDKPDLIIIDTMQRFIRAKDTNDYAEMTLLFDHVLAIAQQSHAAMLLLTHAAKIQREGLDSILGSQAIAGSVDTAIMLTRSDRYRTIYTIQRSGDDLPDCILRMDDRGRVSLAGSRHLADQDYIGQQFVAVLEKAGAPMRRTDLLELVEGRKSLKLAALRELVNTAGTSGTRIVTVTGAGTKSDPFLYSVSGSRVPLKSGNPNLQTADDLIDSAVTDDYSGSRTCTGDGNLNLNPQSREPESASEAEPEPDPHDF